MPILIKSPNSETGISEWCIIELQGDLEMRGDKIMHRQFIGDLSFNKYGQPILIIGHHILNGRAAKIEKPFAVLEKRSSETSSTNPDDTQHNITLSSQDILNRTQDTTILDSTITIENKTKPKTEYTVKAVIRTKLIFRSRPKPIIANVAINNK